MTREEALKILKSWDGHMFLEREEGIVGYSYKKEVSQEAINIAIEALEQLEEKSREEWITGERNGEGYDYFCSRCGHITNEDVNEINFCPKCGAYMRK